MRARDVMTEHVVTVAPDAEVPEVARVLLRHGISAVPVVGRDGQLMGIVSEGDLLRRPELGTERHGSWWLGLLVTAEDAAREYVKTHGRRAADVMSREVIAVGEDTPVEEIARLLEERRIKRVPVVHDGRPVGIVSRADLLRGLAVREPPAAVPRAEDGTIRRDVLQAVREAGLTSPASVSIVVTEGTVHLWGLVHSEEERRALRIAAENVRGVRGVAVHLSVVPVRPWWE